MYPFVLRKGLESYVDEEGGESISAYNNKGAFNFWGLRHHMKINLCTHEVGPSGDLFVAV